MKKKIITTVVIMTCLSGFIYAENFSFEVKGSYFSPSEEAFKDIYGGGFTFGGELTLGILKNLQLWFGGSYFSQNGELTYTKEETSLQIIPLGGGLKYKLNAGILSFYGGAGIKFYQFKESNILGEVTEGGIGYVGKIGVIFKVFKGMFLDLFGEYSYCKMIPADFTINIGGIAAGIGLGFEF